MKRREFLQTVAGAAGGLLLAGRPLYAQPRTAADTIFVNGPVITVNSAQPFAEAVAAKNGRVLAVGGRAEIESHRDVQTQVVDLQGQSLTPGLIDAHSHLLAFGQMELFFVLIRPPQVHDFASLRQVIGQAAARLRPGQWLVARGFNEFDEGRFPTREELDPATPRNPALLIHWTGQYGVANTLALQQQNLLRADVTDPYGGKYLRDPRTGLPNGRLLHYPAIYSVYAPEFTDAEEARSLAWGAAAFLREGITCVHDNFCTAPAVWQYIRQERAGQLPLRVRLYPYVPNLARCQQFLARARRYEGPLVRLQGVKLAVDGYPLMYQVPPQQAQLNMPMHPPDQFQAIISAIHEAGFQVDVHAAGDRAVDLALDAFSRAAGGDRQVRERRHRLEHYMFRRAASIRRTADMGVPVCTQPAWIPMRAGELVRRLGAEAVAGMVPLGSFRRAGVALSFGADVPASPTHLPLDSLIPAVTREAPGAEMDMTERITFLEALEAHTLSAAYAAFDEQEMGSIVPGKLADFATWNADLRQVDDARLRTLRITTTWLGGQCVHRA